MKLTQAELIQVLRRRSNLNPGDLGARAFDTSFESGRTKIKNIELGKQTPTIDDLKKMAVVLGVDDDALLAPDNGVLGPSSAALAAGGLALSAELLDCFPGLEAYLSMLDNAVRLGDTELIVHICDKVASIFNRFNETERAKSGGVAK